MLSPCVEFDRVSKSYQATQILHDVSLSPARDVTTAIVGESGSGKSTLLQLINGLIRPDRGAVKVDDQLLDYEMIHESRRKMGYAVQGAGLFPHMTVYENVTLVARLTGWGTDEIAARFTRLFDLMGIDGELAARFPFSLSGGQQQRVSLCRAMMLNPPLLLLDEPFSALDPITRRSIHAEFQRLQDAEARSILLVTHDMSEALKLAHRLVIIKEGRIVQEGTPEEVRDSPADAYVAHLLEDMEP